MKGKIAKANRKIRDILGCPKNLQGRSASRILPYFNSRSYMEVLPQGTFIFKDEGRGQILRISVSHTENGELIHTVGDITAQKKAQEELILASHLASIGEMAARIAHEVNNPLSVVIGFSDLVASTEEVPTELRGHLEKIREAGRRASEIRHGLLTLAHTERDAGHQSVDLNKIVTRCLGVYGPAVLKDRIKLKLKLDQRLPPIFGNPGQIQQIVLHLIKNATDAIYLSGKGTYVGVKTRKEREEAVLMVEDDGPGIPDELRNRIFDPFFTTKKSEKGTGLGLSIVKRLVEDHGARIEVDSTKGQGTLFTIRFPAMRYAKRVRRKPRRFSKEPL